MKRFCLLILFVLTCAISKAQDLDYYLNKALNNSPLLKDLKNQVASGKLDSLGLRAGYRPQVAVNSAGLYAPVISGYGYDAAITNGQTLNALLGVNQQIISKKMLNSQLDNLKLKKDSINNIALVSIQDLKKAITGQYITAYGSLQQMLFSQKVVDLLAQEESLLKNLTRQNVYRQSDYLTFLVTLKQQQLQLLQARQQYRNDFTTLNYMAGTTDTALIAVKDPAITPAITPDTHSSIFFRQFANDSLRLLNSRRLVDNTYRPKASVFADGGYNSSFAMDSYKNFGTSVGFTLSIPIYDGGQRKLQYKKLNLEEETRRGYQSFFDVQYRLQVAQLKKQISDNEALSRQIKDQVQYTETLIKVDTKLLETGDLHIADLVLAVNNYLSIQNLLTQTTISKLQLINQLNYWNK